MPLHPHTFAKSLQHAETASQGWRDEAEDFLKTTLVSVGSNERAYTAYKQALSKIETLFASLHEAYDELTQAHIRLGREHNQRVRINTLPTEILMIIMQNVVAQDESRQLAAPLKISAVCSYWRSIALNTSSLWSVLNFTWMKPKQIRLYRERARDSPLTLLSFEGEELAKEVFWSSLASLRSLDLARCLDILTAIPTSSLDALESFEYNVLGEEINDPSFSPVLDSPLFQGKTPLLRHLTLISVRMPWNYGYYVDLESLTLLSCSMDKRAQDEDICHVLRDCPRLRKLEIIAGREDGDATASRPPYTLQPVDRAPLRSLQSLKLAMRAVFLARILSSIDTTDALSDVIIHIFPVEAKDVVSASSIPYLLPVAVFSRLDRIHILPRVDSSGSFEGGLKGFATGAASTAQPLLHLIWYRCRRDRLPDFGESMFMHCAQALRLHQQSKLPLTLALDTCCSKHRIDFPKATRLIRAFELTDFVCTQGQDLSVDALPLASSGEDEKRCLNSVRLEGLLFTSGKLSYRRALEMMKWAEQQASLRALHLKNVGIFVQSKKYWEHLEKKIFNLGPKLTMQDCMISFLDGTTRFWKNLNVPDDEDDGDEEEEEEEEEDGEDGDEYDD